MNRSIDITTFLKQVYRNSNNQRINSNIIYQLLMFGTLQVTDIDRRTNRGMNIEPLWKGWEKHFKRSSSSVRPVLDDYFLGFDSVRRIEDGDFIKLYVPLDLKHLDKGVKLLFDFINKEGIVHSSKVRRIMAADNVIVRLRKGDYKSRDKILDFINNNNFFKDSFNKPNPFVPTMSNNIGIMDEHGNSYNSDISYYIAEYINRSKQMSNPNVSAEGFHNFLLYCCEHNIRFDGKTPFDYSLLKTYENSLFGFKLDNVEEKNNNFSEEQKHAIFMDAIKNTFSHYGIKQIKDAIFYIIDEEDYTFISNKDCDYNIRALLKDNVMPGDIVKYIDNYLRNKNQLDMRLKIKEKIDLYVNQLFSNQLTILFDEICTLTLEKYGDVALRNAIKNFINKNETKGFSRFGLNSDINYREKLSMFDRKSMYGIMYESLINKGVMVDLMEIDDLIELYVSELSKAKYIAFDNRPSIAK